MPKIIAKFDPSFTGNTDFHSTYVYDRIKQEWKFTGYKCVYCERTLLTNPTNSKHLKNCKGISHRKPKDEVSEPTLLNKYGSEWTPIDSNLNKSSRKRSYLG